MNPDYVVEMLTKHSGVLECGVRWQPRSLTITSPKVRGWKKAHRSVAERRDMPRRHGEYRTVNYQTNTETVTSVWVA